MRERNLLIVALLSFILVVFLASFALGAINVPSSSNVRVSYYRTLYRITNPQNSPARIKALHKVQDIETENRSAVKAQSARCISCHGSMVDKTTKPKKSRRMHEAMLTADFLDFGCVDCHKDVDLRDRDRKHVTVKIDRKLCASLPCHDAKIMAEHGEDDAKANKAWIAGHPQFAKSVGIGECRKCHVEKSELDFCNDCHLKKGFRPESHKARYTAPMNEIYPLLTDVTNPANKVINPIGEPVEAVWRGWHFVQVREELQAMGVTNISAQNLPMDKLDKLGCGACHVLQEWCTKCHIKHGPNWFDSNEGHPARVPKEGTTNCEQCHDLGSKCIACHTYVGQLQ